MTESFKLFRRKSLFTHTMVSVVILALVSFIGIVTGWRLLDQSSQLVEQVSEKAIPLVTAAQSLNKHTANIQLMTSNISLYDETAQLDQLFDEFEVELKSLEVLQKQLTDLSPVSEALEDIDREIADIRQNLAGFKQHKYSQLNQRKSNLALQSEAVQANRQFSGQIETVTEKYSDRIFDVSVKLSENNNPGAGKTHAEQLILLNQDNDLLLHIQHDSIETDALLNTYSERLTPSQVQVASGRLNLKLRKIISDLALLTDSEDVSRLKSLISVVYRLVRHPSSIEKGWIDLYQLNLELEQARGKLLANVFELNELARKLVEVTETRSGQSSQEAVQSTSQGKELLFILSIASLLLSIYIIWFVVVRKIILPLRELTESMRKLSLNVLDIEVNQYPLIELNEMARSLEVFRDRSVSLEDHQHNLEDRNQQLKRINEDLNTFVHVASHELKSPLRGIRILSEFIARDIEQQNTHKAGENLLLMQRRISRIDRLLNSLLAYTNTGTTNEVVQSVFVERVISDAFDLVNTNGRFSLTLGSEIPECRVIESELTIIFLNLFDNAIVHHDADTGNIRVLFRETDSSYIFTVEDDGPGIDPEYHELIFDVLKTLKSRDEVEGSGVGLSQVKRLLESKGGEISVVSNPAIERGSRFIIHYPRVT